MGCQNGKGEVETLATASSSIADGRGARRPLLMTVLANHLLVQLSMAAGSSRAS
jgi:hypothetical protein